jgi:L-fuculose-phosphate aldolase
MASIADQIAEVAGRLFQRRLLDMAGGNVSAREGDCIYVTPRYSGSRRHWQLIGADIVSGPYQTDELFGHPAFSREGKAHLAVYRNFPDVGAVIHAHPFHVLPFSAAHRPIEPVLEQTQKFGVVDVVPEAPAHSDELATNVVAGLRSKEANIRKQAAAVILPTHGILVAGKDLLAAADALERIDWNAWCIIARSMLPPFPIAEGGSPQ